MSVADPSFVPPLPPLPGAVRPDQVLPLHLHVDDREAVIPRWVVDLASFRAWANSEHFPRQGQYAFLDGVIWADLSREELLTHNLVKTRFTVRVFAVLEDRDPLFSDRALLTNAAANLSTEPDLTFAFWETFQSGRIQMAPGKKRGYMELEGTPDWILEIVSDSSTKKDKEILPSFYWKAGVPEFWLVDARQAPAEFQIFRHGVKGYELQESQEKGVYSPLFGRYFQLVQGENPLGQVSFEVKVSV